MYIKYTCSCGKAFFDLCGIEECSCGNGKSVQLSFVSECCDKEFETETEACECEELHDGGEVMGVDEYWRYRNSKMLRY